MKIFFSIILFIFSYSYFAQDTTPEPPPKFNNPFQKEIDDAKKAAIKDFENGLYEYYIQEGNSVNNVESFICYHDFITKKTGVTIKYYSNCGIALSIEKVEYAEKMNLLITEKFGESFYKKWNKKAIKNCKN